MVAETHRATLSPSITTTINGKLLTAQVIITVRTNKFKLWLFIVLVLSAVSILSPAEAITVPWGFYLVSQDVGIKLYRKDYAGGFPDFVLAEEILHRNSTSLIRSDDVNGIGQIFHQDKRKFPRSEGG